VQKESLRFCRGIAAGFQRRSSGEDTLSLQQYISFVASILYKEEVLKLEIDITLVLKDSLDDTRAFSMTSKWFEYVQALLVQRQ
jgi:hypothetical protein